jgi:hypothetical protein
MPRTDYIPNPDADRVAAGVDILTMHTHAWRLAGNTTGSASSYPRCKQTKRASAYARANYARAT